MNFANLLLTKANTYRFVCQQSPETIIQTIDTLASNKRDTKVTLVDEINLPTLSSQPDALKTPLLATAETTRGSALTTENSASVINQAIASTTAEKMRIKRLDVTKRILKQHSDAKFRFEAGRSNDMLRRLFQPRIFGVVSGSGSDTTVELKTQLPFLPTKLINWSANISLFSLFGMIGSYLLLPTPEPLLAVLTKVTFLPAMFAIFVAFICQYFIRTDARAVADELAEKSHARRIDSIAPITAEVYAKTFFSLNSVITIAFCGSILAAACLLHNWAWEQWTTGKYDKSEALCLKVLDLARFALGKDNAGVAGCQYYIAECSRCEGKLDQAEKYYLQTLTDLKRNIDPKNTSIADTIINLGRVYEQQKKYDKALDCYMQAKKLFEDAPAFGPRCIWIGHIWNKIAAVQYKQKRFSDAEKSENKALPIDTGYKWMAGESIAGDTNDLGVIYYGQGQYERARAQFAEAVRLKSTLSPKSMYSKGTSLYNLSLAQEKLGEKDMAKNSRRQAFDLWQKHIDANNGSSLSAHDLYEKVLAASKPDYEVPNYDRRADMIVDGTGRI